jgi:hypothetical protein
MVARSSPTSDHAEGTAGGYGDAFKLVLNVYRVDRAAASNSPARGLTRMSSVKFSQRTVSERSIRNSAGRAISVPSRTSAWMQKFESPNHLGLQIGKKWECVASFVARFSETS